MGELLALLALVFFSGNALLVSVVSGRLGQEVGFLLALLTNIAFSGLLVVIQHAVFVDGFDLHWDAFLLFAIGGFFTSYLGRRLFFLSVQSIGPSRASSLQITNPVFAGIISWILLGEALGLDAIAYLLAVVVGLYLTTQVRAKEPAPVPEGGPLAASPDGPTFSTLPTREIVLALVAALSYAVGNVARSTGVRRWDEPIFAGFVGAVVGTIAYLVLHTKIRTVVQTIREADRLGVALWSLSGVLTISAQVCVIASTRHIPIAVAVVVSAALPVIVIPVSVIFMHNREAVSGRTVVGGLLIFGGVAGLLLL